MTMIETYVPARAPATLKSMKPSVRRRSRKPIAEARSFDVLGSPSFGYTWKDDRDLMVRDLIAALVPFVRCVATVSSFGEARLLIKGTVTSMRELVDLIQDLAYQTRSSKAFSEDSDLTDRAAAHLGFSVAMDLLLEGEATTSFDAHARADFLIRWANVLSDHQRAKAFDLVVPDIRSLLWCELPAPQQAVVSYTTTAPVPPNLIGDTYRRGDVLLLAHMTPSIGAETAILILDKSLVKYQGTPPAAMVGTLVKETNFSWYIETALPIRYLWKIPQRASDFRAYRIVGYRRGPKTVAL